jgi:hypothetical protein
VYNDFCEIPLPALRFEKTEKIDIKTTTLKKGTTLSGETTFGTLIIREKQ